MRFSMIALLLLFGSPVLADGERSGDFDYYVMSLSWSPNWCDQTGDARGDPQCDAGRGFSFTLHGLWPQYEAGYPSYCRTVARDPTRSDTAAMADIMGGRGWRFTNGKSMAAVRVWTRRVILMFRGGRMKPSLSPTCSKV